MFDLDAYLERIGLKGRPSIARVHRAHLTSIPFENLDPHQGLPVSLEIEDLERKLVTERRGGYCFEQNLLLKAAIEALGAEVDMFLARMRVGAKPDVVRPRSHLVLRVRENGASWHTDVGFARGILEPIPFGPGPTQEQSGWSFRVIEDGSELVLQNLEGDKWVDVYGFLPLPVPLVDVEISNWWTSTHPHSPFVTGLIVGVRGDDGTSTLLCDWSGLSLSEQTLAGTSVTPLERKAVPELLATRFSLPGFALGTDERLVRVAAANLVETPLRLPGPSDWFTGAVYIDAVAAPPAPNRAQANLVYFTPGARTAWHTHPLGQTIYVTEGIGLCQREGGQIEIIRPGDRVFFESGENHWHGATPNRFMVHIAIQEADDSGSPVTWGKHVTDEEYQAASTL